MRLLKYIPQIACAAILLLATLAATPALGQVINSALTFPVPATCGGPPANPRMIAGCFVSATNGANDASRAPLDYDSTGYFRAVVRVPAGVANAIGVTIRGVFTPGDTTPAGRLAGFATGFGGGCVIPDPLPLGNTDPNTFSCSLGNLDDGGGAVERRPVISQPRPPAVPASCPTGTTPGTLTMTASATNAAPVMFTKAVITEDLADVSVSVSGPIGANVGDTVTYNVRITNFGPCPAENICATNVNSALGLVFVSNSGDCTKPYGACLTFRPTYNPSSECGFSANPSGAGGTLNPGQTFNITSTYRIDALPRSVTSIGDFNEVDIVSDTNLVNYGTHSQTSTVNTVVANETSCSVAGTGGSSIAVVGLVVLVAYALNRRKRS